MSVATNGIHWTLGGNLVVQTVWGETWRQPTCPLLKMDIARANSDAGRLLVTAQELDFMLKSQFTVTADDINAEEYKALQILYAERERWKQEVTSQPPT